MIIANLRPNGICHTIYDVGDRVVEINDTNVEIPEYSTTLYLRSHYDKESGEWTFCPGIEYLWNEELKEFYLPEPLAQRISNLRGI